MCLALAFPSKCHLQCHFLITVIITLRLPQLDNTISLKVILLTMKLVGEKWTVSISMWRHPRYKPLKAENSVFHQLCSNYGPEADLPKCLTSCFKVNICNVINILAFSSVSDIFRATQEWHCDNKNVILYATFVCFSCNLNLQNVTNFNYEIQIYVWCAKRDRKLVFLPWNDHMKEKWLVSLSMTT